MTHPSRLAELERQQARQERRRQEQRDVLLSKAALCEVAWSVDQASLWLGLSVRHARRYVEGLVGEGLLRRVTPSPTPRGGRPVLLYCLAAMELPDPRRAEQAALYADLVLRQLSMHRPVRPRGGGQS